MEIKNVIRDKRLELGLTMKEVAAAVGVSEGTVSRWESGEISNMRRDKIAALASVLEISPAVIMGWTDAPHPETSTLSSLEEIVLSNFRLLDHSDQIEVGGIIKGMLLNDKYKKDAGDRTA